MKVAYTRVFMGALVSLAATAAYAEKAQLVSHTMFAELEQEVSSTHAELAELKAELASFQNGAAPSMMDMECCCRQSSWLASAEITFLKFHEADGVQDADGEEASFDYETSPRISLGYLSCDGLGARARYWEYNHDTESENDEDIFVDTYYIDFEVFQQIALNDCTMLEASTGVRYNEFLHVRDGDNDPDTEEIFRGWGGMVGVEVTRNVGCCWDFYGRLREVIMVGDAQFDDDGGDDENRSDTVRPVTEIALGVRYHRCNWTLNAAYEWQNWGNYTNAPEAQEITRDVGFSGFVFGAELSY